MDPEDYSLGMNQLSISAHHGELIRSTDMNHFLQLISLYELYKMSIRKNNIMIRYLLLHSFSKHVSFGAALPVVFSATGLFTSYCH